MERCTRSLKTESDRAGGMGGAAGLFWWVELSGGCDVCRMGRGLPGHLATR